jgi:hypothetical protein
MNVGTMCIFFFVLPHVYFIRPALSIEFTLNFSRKIFGISLSFVANNWQRETAFSKLLRYFIFETLRKKKMNN